MPRSYQKLDHQLIAQRRADGLPWVAIAQEIGHKDVDSLRSSHSSWRRTRLREASTATAEAREQSPGEENFNDFDVFTRTLTGEELVGLRTLADLAVFFDVDLDQWEPYDFNVTGNTWQNKAKGEPVTNLHQYKVRARFRRRQEYIQPLLEEMFQGILDDLEEFHLMIPEVEPLEGAARDYRERRPRA